LQQIRNSFPEAYLVVEDSTPQTTPASAVNAYNNESAYAPPTSYGNVAGARLPSSGDLTAKGTSYILPSGTTGYAIQLASYGKEENAVSFIGRLRQRGFSDVYVWKKDGNNRVVVGTFTDKISAANYLETIKRQYSQDGIVVYIYGR
ncbi:MAG: SPOR domain-containing protein, partial [Sinomicrobium sp.]|nr:SPOR domain-containing protein [Sinomicrobium sp.]